MLGASSPLRLPPQCLSFAVVADALLDLTPVSVIEKEGNYVYYGSIDAWRELFLSNPPIDLDPFYYVLSQVLRVKKEHEKWMSK